MLQSSVRAAVRRWRRLAEIRGASTVQSRRSSGYRSGRDAGEGTGTMPVVRGNVRGGRRQGRDRVITQMRECAPPVCAVELDAEWGGRWATIKCGRCTRENFDEWNGGTPSTVITAENFPSCIERVVRGSLCSLSLFDKKAGKKWKGKRRSIGRRVTSPLPVHVTVTFLPVSCRHPALIRDSELCIFGLSYVSMTSMLGYL